MTTKKEFYDRFVNLFTEQLTIGEDIKALTEEAEGELEKEDVVMMKAVAKLHATGKIGQAYEKSEKMIQAIDEFAG